MKYDLMNIYIVSKLIVMMMGKVPKILGIPLEIWISG